MTYCLGKSFFPRFQTLRQIHFFQTCGNSIYYFLSSYLKNKTKQNQTEIWKSLSFRCKERIVMNILKYKCSFKLFWHSVNLWAPSSEFLSSSILSWQILTAHAQPFRGARDLAFCLKVPLDSLLVWTSSGGSGETARMRRLAWTFAARIGDKYQIRLTRSICHQIKMSKWC